MGSFQIVIISTGILSLALLFKISVPLVIDFSVNQAPGLWISFASWLKPPYLYFILNCIIITIAASSRFHYGSDDSSNHDNNDKCSHEMPSAAKSSEHQFHSEINVSTVAVAAAELWPRYGGQTEEEEEQIVLEVEKVSADAFEDKSTLEVEDEFVISKSSWIPSKRLENLQEFLVLPDEKPLVSARFGHRKSVKASPEGGRALRVAKPKRQETLENTWKTITEGRPMPLTRHLKKSDTFDNRVCQVTNVSETESRIPRKSETFKDRTNYQLSPVGNGNSPASKLRKEPSLSQDELNRRVEAFIKKFNDEMRLQRQQSLNQYKEMISR